MHYTTRPCNKAAAPKGPTFFFLNYLRHKAWERNAH